MTARTYTPEAIEKLVAAVNSMRPFVSRLHHPDINRAAIEALRPFTTEPSSWESYARELWGEGWRFTPPYPGAEGRFVSLLSDEYRDARAAYRARYGVEP